MNVGAGLVPARAPFAQETGGDKPRPYNDD